MAARKQGPGVQGIGLALAPIALYFSGLLRLLWDAIVAIGNWASKIIFSPAVWFGLSLLALCLVLWVVGGIVARRSRRRSPRPSARRMASRPCPPIREAQSSNAESSKSRAAKTTRNAPPIDDEMAEIEALLKSRGIE